MTLQEAVDYLANAERIKKVSTQRESPTRLGVYIWAQRGLSSRTIFIGIDPSADDYKLIVEDVS